MELLKEIDDILGYNGLEGTPFKNGKMISYKNIEIFMCGNVRALDIDIIENLTGIQARVYFDMINEKKKEKLDELILKYNSKNPYRFVIDKDGYLTLNLLVKHTPMSKALEMLERFILTCLGNPSDIKKVVNC